MFHLLLLEFWHVYVQGCWDGGGVVLAQWVMGIGQSDFYF